MTYPAALEILGQARRLGMKLGLEPMRQLAEALGRPQDTLRFIHLAGTNGKGSTAAFLESGLREHGYRVGLFTSPHLVSIRERMQINRVPISEADFAEGLHHVHKTAQRLDLQPTFFELITALGLWYFSRECVDWVVWETGLGGRLDATNIVTPELVIITNIAMDHQAYLGDSLEKIALEKAGIIKAGVPVITAVESGPARDMILATAQKQTAPVQFIFADNYQDHGMQDTRQHAKIFDQEYQLGLLGPHQIGNATVAVAALTHLKIPRPVQQKALAATQWPGRFQILSESPLRVIDGAHNPAGAAQLAQTWRQFLAARGRENSPTQLVFASVADKEISGVAEHLRPLAQCVSLVRLANERTAEPKQLASFFPDATVTLHESVSALWAHLKTSPPSEALLIAGSLFLAGEILSLQRGQGEEYRWNERLETLTSSR